ncbi:hypothetical protein CPB84DRAFT_255794 [Gymnopilus junonius]|uniref:Protein kinase domain-containing protein n=1 Tax=Gymnopilus junonius TaxID=109634 RepID=A0A9P5NC09_GYMJU|nr:hypothetical protein CPB84DRAFT_255794 [Gymnopilus junonius]
MRSARHFLHSPSSLGPPSPPATVPGPQPFQLFSHHLFSRPLLLRRKGTNGVQICSVWCLRCWVKLCSASSNCTRQQRSSNRSQNRFSSDSRHRCGVVHTDLRPENVVICIDDIEYIISTAGRFIRHRQYPNRPGSWAYHTPKIAEATKCPDPTSFHRWLPAASFTLLLGWKPYARQWAIGISKSRETTARQNLRLPWTSTR